MKAYEPGLLLNNTFRANIVWHYVDLNYPVWLGRLTHLLREAQSHWPPFCLHSQLCKNDTRAD